MITTPTVIVLGAGASMPYGFPSGEQLLRLIVSNRITLPLECSSQAENEIAFARLFQFQQKVKNSQPESIDSFLQDYPGYRDIGKQYIARVLIKREDHARLLSFRVEDHWLRELWKAIKARPESFQHNRLVIINFNYDRSVEHYLTTVMANTFEIPISRAYSVIKSIPIFHPHGMLAPYQATENGRFDYIGNDRPYNSEVNMQLIDTAAKHLNLFWEQQAHDIDALVTQSLGEVERIIFLGYGFLRSNEHVIAQMLKTHYEAIRWATCYNMPKLQMHEASLLSSGRNGCNLFPEKSSWLLQNEVQLADSY